MRHTRKVVKRKSVNKNSRKHLAKKHSKKGGSVHKRKHTVKHTRNTRKPRKMRRQRKTMRGGVKYVPSNADFKGFNETVPYKVGTGLSAGNVANGENHYALSSTSLHEPNGAIINTSLHTAVPNNFLNGQMGGSGSITKLMPQDLVNLGRSVIENGVGLYDNVVGQHTAPTYDVMEQPINNIKNPVYVPTDVNTIHMNAENVAANV